MSPDGAVTLRDVEADGDGTVEVIFKDASGRIGERLHFRSDEPNLRVVRGDGGWRFDGDGARFRLAAEARRIGSAYLFDPRLAVHTSLVDPYPHQISAVYERMLNRQPLRFLLADDPGAGKTSMAGLLIKELIARGDLERCMIVCPGSLVEQWQDELRGKFGLPFKIIAREQVESSATGNPFAEEPLAICRLDHLARNEGIVEPRRGHEFLADSFRRNPLPKRGSSPLTEPTSACVVEKRAGVAASVPDLVEGRLHEALDLLAPKAGPLRLYLGDH